MKWFKHMTDSLDDPFIQELIMEFGANGYLAWFGIIEIICKENGNQLTGNLSISPTFLKQKFHISSGKLQEIFDFSSRKGKLFFNISEEKFNFSLTKILEIKDNYTKDLQGACKKPSNHKEEEVEEEAEADKDKEIPYIPFKEIIEDLNQKTGKKFRISAGTKKLISARLKEGFTQEDFAKVHDNMSAKWKANPKMNQYLRPATLYCESKFQGYLNMLISLSDHGIVSVKTEKNISVMQSWLDKEEAKNA